MTTPVGTITNVKFYDPNRGDYFASAPALSLGQTTYVGATGNNTSAYPTNLQLVFIVTKPNGTKITINGTLAAVAAGGSVLDVAAVTVDQVGTWKVEIRLMGQYTGTTSGLIPGPWTYWSQQSGYVYFINGTVLPIDSIFMNINCQNTSTVPRTANVVLYVKPPGQAASQYVSKSVDIAPNATSYLAVGWDYNTGTPQIPITSNGFVFTAELYLDGVLCAVASMTAG